MHCDSKLFIIMKKMERNQYEVQIHSVGNAGYDVYQCMGTDTVPSGKK